MVKRGGGFVAEEMGWKEVRRGTDGQNRDGK